MLRVPRRSLITACLLVGLVASPAALLAEEAGQPAQKPAAAAPAEKGDCPMGGCPACAKGASCCASGQPAADCPCQHAKRARKSSGKSKRKARTQQQTQQ